MEFGSSSNLQESGVSNQESVIMKRRTFIKTFIVTGVLGVVGGLKMLAETRPVQKLLYAVKLKKYPGKIKPLGKLKESKDLLG